MKKLVENNKKGSWVRGNFSINNRNSQDLKLTKYLSPVNKHYRIAYKDPTIHRN